MTTKIEDYWIVRGGETGLTDFSPRGRIEVSGGNAVQFLNGYVTNDIKKLDEGQWIEAAFPNVQGRLLAAARILNTKGVFLIDTDIITREIVFKTLERFIPAGDFYVNDVTEQTALLSIQGANSSEFIYRLFQVSTLNHGQVKNLLWEDNPIILIRATHTGEDGFDLFIHSNIKQALSETFLSLGAKLISKDALDTLRVESGIPLFGIDMNETNIVSEAPMENAISYTKGCYIGQEILARIHWRGHVAKKLTGLISETNKLILKDSKVKSIDGKEIGRITSSCYSPKLNKNIALAYVKYDYLTPGTQVNIEQEDEQIEATVTKLPFIKGSWPENTNTN
jgi:folate-binding protein YgfZ